MSDEIADVGRELDSFVFSLHRPTFAWRGKDAWERVREYAFYAAWKYEEMQIARDRTGQLASAPPLTVEREHEIKGGRGLSRRAGRAYRATACTPGGYAQ